MSIPDLEILTPDAAVTEIGEAIKRDLRRHACQAVVIEISGGIDSALVAAALKRAGIPLTLVVLPCEEGSPVSSQAVVEAARVASWLELPLEMKNVCTIYKACNDDLPLGNNQALNNSLLGHLKFGILHYLAGKNGFSTMVVRVTNSLVYTSYSNWNHHGTASSRLSVVIGNENLRPMLEVLDAPRWLLDRASALDQTDD